MLCRIALTATATERVKNDVKTILGITNAKEFRQSFNRPNLIYEVLSKPQGMPAQAFVIKSWIYQYGFQTQPGIVYVMSRAETKNLARHLTALGLPALSYHGGMAAHLRAMAQRQWTDGKVRLIIATIAFGMGIDKFNVRFVIHHTIAKSIEELYQGDGRAGRDGKSSRCMLLWSENDIQRVKDLVSGSPTLSPLELTNQLALVDNVADYCKNTTDCRRGQLLKYFNEPLKADTGDKSMCCDVCSRGRFPVSLPFVEKVDYTTQAQHLVSMVDAIWQKRPNRPPFPCRAYLAQLYTGSRDQKVTSAGDESLPYHGAGRSLPGDKRAIIAQILDALVRSGALALWSRRTKRRCRQVKCYALGRKAWRFGSIEIDQPVTPPATAVASPRTATRVRAVPCSPVRPAVDFLSSDGNFDEV
jgi:bloom syndrome protein